MRMSLAIIAYRETHSLTQSQFAELLNVDERQVGRWERLESKPSKASTARIMALIAHKPTKKIVG